VRYALAMSFADPSRGRAVEVLDEVGRLLVEAKRVREAMFLVTKERNSHDTDRRPLEVWRGGFTNHRRRTKFDGRRPRRSRSERRLSRSRGRRGSATAARYGAAP
jgi:hypothetical protein